MSAAAVAQGEKVDNWAALRDEIIAKVDANVAEFDVPPPFTDPLTGVTTTAEELRLAFDKALYSYEAAPFTVQRLAELAVDTGNYGKKDAIKYLHALLRNVTVTSTVDDFDDLDEGLRESEEPGVILSAIDWHS